MKGRRAGPLSELLTYTFDDSRSVLGRMKGRLFHVRRERIIVFFIALISPFNSFLNRLGIESLIAMAGLRIPMLAQQ